MKKKKKKTAKKRQIDYKFALKDQIENKIKLSFFYIFEHWITNTFFFLNIRLVFQNKTFYVHFYSSDKDPAPQKTLKTI